ncbi:MAG: hypothetical protein AAFO68_07490 [Pseudomonadota bacterium]
MNLASKAFAVAISLATMLAAAVPAQANSFRSPMVKTQSSDVIHVGKRHRRGAAIVGGLVLGAIVGGAIARDRGYRRHYRGHRRYYRGHRKYRGRYYRGHSRYYRKWHRGGRKFRPGYGYGSGRGDK